MNRNEKKKRAPAVAVAAIAGVLLAGAAAEAQPAHDEPASLLVYPHFDSRPSHETVIFVTNTNEDRRPCGGNDRFMRGDVRLHFVYYGVREADLGDPSGARWLEFDRYEMLSPGDTIAVLARSHDPDAEVGFLTVKALSPDTDEAIDFDHLVGSALVVEAEKDALWSYEPFAFQARGNGAISTCGHELVDGPGTRFGPSYSAFPAALFLDSFAQVRNGVVGGELTLMSTSGPDYLNEVDVLFWNNREERFSRQLSFRCWTTVRLEDISSIATRLGGDPDESPVQTGWLRLAGRRVLDLAAHPVTDGDLANGPALLAVFRQPVRAFGIIGRPLQFSGTKDASLPN